MAKSCPRCSLVFEQDEGSRLGSAMVNYAVVAFCLVAYIAGGFVWTWPDPPPLVPMMAGAVGLILLVALFFFPFAKTTWAAIDLVLHGFEPERETPMS